MNPTLDRWRRHPGIGAVLWRLSEYLRGKPGPVQPVELLEVAGAMPAHVKRDPYDDVLTFDLLTAESERGELGREMLYQAALLARQDQILKALGKRMVFLPGWEAAAAAGQDLSPFFSIELTADGRAARKAIAAEAEPGIEGEG